MRRRGRFDELALEIAGHFEDVAQSNAQRANHDIEDDRLRLIFTCCHPAIDPKVQVPLTLREVCGLSTEEVASAFLTAPATMAQRIVRGKAKIRDAGIPFVIPTAEDFPERLESVLADYHLTDAARAELCRRAGRIDEARDAYQQALSLVRQEPERRFLTRRLSETFVNRTIP